MDDEQEQSRQKIVAYLAGRGGSVDDPEGRGLTTEMAKAVGLDRPGGLSDMLGRMEAEGTIKRDVRGLRTYRIALCDEGPTAPIPAAAPQGVAGRRLSRLATGPATAPGQWKEEGLPARAGAPAAPAIQSAPAAAAAAPGAWRDLEPEQQEGPPTGRLATLRTARTGENQGGEIRGIPDRQQPPAAKTKKARRQWWKETPKVAGPPSQSIERIVWAVMGVFVLVAIVAALIAGSLSSRSSAAARGSADACILMSMDEASAVLGAAPGPPSNVIGSCLFEAGPKKLIVAVTNDRARAQFEANRGTSSQVATGIGDRAFYQDGRLYVLKGPNLVVITQLPAPAEVSPPVAALARTVLGRM